MSKHRKFLKATALITIYLFTMQTLYYCTDTSSEAKSAASIKHAQSSAGRDSFKTIAAFADYYETFSVDSTSSLIGSNDNANPAEEIVKTMTSTELATEMKNSTDLSTNILGYISQQVTKTKKIVAAIPESVDDETKMAELEELLAVDATELYDIVAALVEPTHQPSTDDLFAAMILNMQTNNSIAIGTYFNPFLDQVATIHEGKNREDVYPLLTTEKENLTKDLIAAARADLTKFKASNEELVTTLEKLEEDLSSGSLTFHQFMNKIHILAGSMAPFPEAKACFGLCVGAFALYTVAAVAFIGHTGTSTQKKICSRSGQDWSFTGGCE